eukprot:1890383-Pyramimonas_sp.AAC.1
MAQEKRQMLNGNGDTTAETTESIQVRVNMEGGVGHVLIDPIQITVWVSEARETTVGPHSQLHDQ